MILKNYQPLPSYDFFVYDHKKSKGCFSFDEECNAEAKKMQTWAIVILVIVMAIVFLSCCFCQASTIFGACPCLVAFFKMNKLGLQKKYTIIDVNAWVHHRFEVYDENNNGYLEMAEVRKMSHLMHHNAKANNKRMTEAEFQKLFKRVDKNGDGKIGPEELCYYFVDELKKNGCFKEEVEVVRA